MLKTKEDRKKYIEDFIKKVKEDLSPYSNQVFDRFREATNLEKEKKNKKDN